MSAEDPEGSSIASRLALSALTAGERERSAVYLLPHRLAAGEELRAGRTVLKASTEASVAFVDLDPGANWSHDCRYLLLDSAAGRVESVPARFPPDSRGLHLIHRGDRVEDWMLLEDPGA